MSDHRADDEHAFDLLEDIVGQVVKHSEESDLGALLPKYQKILSKSRNRKLYKR